jgi:CRISPR-associated endonuclease Csn1
MRIDEDLTLGIDLGIASCGWAVIRGGDGEGEIVKLGVWMFDAPETDKERTPTNQLRRGFRGMRRVLKRRRQRMHAIRRLFKQHGLIESEATDALRVASLDPWRLRAVGLDRKLTGPEFAVALGHIAKHRGFKSNSKRDRGANKADDSSKMLSAIDETREKLAKYRSVGEMFAKDQTYARRKRNRDGDYTRSVLRADQEREVKLLFATQRRAGNPPATAELEAAFVDIAFFQRPLADSEDKVGFCPFEEGERRAAKRSYYFELFRFLARLATLRIGKEERPLTSDEIARIDAEFGKQKSLTFKALRRLIDLPPEIGFAGVKPEDEKNDFVARSGAGAEGAATLRKVVTENAGAQAWLSLMNAPDTLDRVAFVLTFREDIASIRRGLEELGLDPMVVEALMRGVDDGAFAKFTGAGHISGKAARNMIPHLRRGLVYSDAAKAAGYDHAKRPETDLQSIANPVARKALTEALKQVKALVQVYGLPGRVHIELAREVGKSKEERDDISRGIEKRNKQKDRLRQEYEELVGRPCAGAEDLLRFELWKEQDGRCLYTDTYITPDKLVAADNTIQVDHILPWSRSGDDSFINKTLCLVSANQAKKGATPHEWFGKDEARWEAFRARVEGQKWMKGRKKRNYLLKDSSVLEEKFRPRNLNDTRYAARLLADQLKRLYPDDGTRRVFARPGPLTDRLRRGWGIQDLKKDEEGARRSDDRHHALDALICAAMSESALIRLTRSWQACEAIGSHRDFANLDPPWPGFVEEARTKLREVFVARAERRRARGEAHAATIREIAARDGKDVVYEKKKVEALTLADLDRIKDPERNQALIATLRAWIEAGKPADRPPVKRFGGPNTDGIEKEPERFEPIRKVKLRTNKKVDVLVRDGAAERGEMVRIDVFRKQNTRGKWEYFLVPVYPHQVADAEDWPAPPNRICRGAVPETEWAELTGDHEFLWSLHPFSFVEVEKPDGTLIDGYFRGLDRFTAAISLSAHRSKDAVIRGIGPQRLTSFSKWSIDRLGRRFEVARETRTWRGEACT